jgi:hypothetical protein
MPLPHGVKMDVRKVRYAVVRDALERLQVTETENDPMALIVWWDGLMQNEDFSTLLPHQRVNKIPGMDVLCYKNTFFQALGRMKALFPSLYSFFPTTFQLPFQFGDFQREHLRLSSKGGLVTWIIKPRSGSCGNGIRLVQNSFSVAAQTQLAVIQRYVSPFLLGGLKFDFRFYILIATIQPFTIYAYHEGLARFCTRAYVPPRRENLDDRFCHLTNTAVNVANAGGGRVILELATVVLQRIAELDQRGRQLCPVIKQIMLLSIVAHYSNILQNVGLVGPDGRRFEGRPPQANLDEMHRHFHILGIDIMLNDRCEPVVLELNGRPSMSVTYDIEQDLKSQLVYDALNVITVDGTEPPDTQQDGGWEKLFPAPDSLFGRAVQSVLERSCQSSHMTAKKMLVKRLGYVPSAFYGRQIYRKSLVLPPLQ